MNKFEIIEEGRLNKSEMNELIGGAYFCTGEFLGFYTVLPGCMGNGTISYSNCQIGYSSCTTAGGIMSCGDYGGHTGPGGTSITIPGGIPVIGPNGLPATLPSGRPATGSILNSL